jgi:N-acyl-D-aspartate/D-glutamate deacylase
MPDATVPSGQRTVFRDGLVFDGSGTPPGSADVVVRRQSIESVRAGGGTEVLPGDQVIERARPGAVRQALRLHAA